MNPFPRRLLRSRRALHLERLQGELQELQEQQREFVTESAERKDKDLDTAASEDDDWEATEVMGWQVAGSGLVLQRPGPEPDDDWQLLFRTNQYDTVVTRRGQGLGPPGSGPFSQQWHRPEMGGTRSGRSCPYSLRLAHLCSGGTHLLDLRPETGPETRPETGPETWPTGALTRSRPRRWFCCWVSSLQPGLSQNSRTFRTRTSSPCS